MKDLEKLVENRSFLIIWDKPPALQLSSYVIIGNSICLLSVKSVNRLSIFEHAVTGKMKPIYHVDKILFL